MATITAVLFAVIVGLLAGIAPAMGLTATVNNNAPAVVKSAAGISQVTAPRRFDKGFELISPSGEYKLSFQSDGNLVIYANGKAIWATMTVQSAQSLWFQADGNFVLYGANSQPLVNTMSYQKGGQTLALQDDGNLVIYNNNRQPIWALWGVVGSQAMFKNLSVPKSASDPNTTQTPPCKTSNKVCAGYSFQKGDQLISPNGNHKLVFEASGDWLLYNGSTAIYSSNTAGKNPAIVFQGDGNLVLYGANNQVLAATMSQNKQADILVLQDDGNLVIYAGSAPVWALFGKAGSSVMFTKIPPPDPSKIRNITLQGQVSQWQLRGDAASSLENIAQLWGSPIQLNSAYRSYETQRDIFLERYIPRKSGQGGGEFCDVKTWNGIQYVRISPEGSAAVPGTSNHGSGLAIDIGGFDGFGDQTRLRFLALARDFGWNDAEGCSVGEWWHLVYNPAKDKGKTNWTPTSPIDKSASNCPNQGGGGNAPSTPPVCKWG